MPRAHLPRPLADADAARQGASILNAEVDDRQRGSGSPRLFGCSADFLIALKRIPPLAGAGLRGWIWTRRAAAHEHDLPHCLGMQRGDPLEVVNDRRSEDEHWEPLIVQAE